MGYDHLRSSPTENSPFRRGGGHFMEINPHEIYTTQETQKLLKVSNSTIKRMLKNGLLRANKIGKQYRILGHEILRLVSPEVERKAVQAYQGIKTKARVKLENW